MPTQHTPKTRREALERYHALLHDVKRQEAQETVANEYGVHPVTVRKWLQKAKAAAPAVPVYTPNVEQLSSADFEVQPTIQAIPPRRDDGFHRLNPDRNERWLILPDMQVPYHDQKTLDAVLSYASEIEWDGFIQLGDYMDWDFISRWTADNAKKIEGQRFMEHYALGNAVLDQIQNAARNRNPNAKGIVIEGNHDWRVENWVSKTPSLTGYIEMEKNLRFAERNMTYWTYWQHRQPFVIGKAWFIHGEYIGTHHAKKTADSFHRNVYYGHTHDRQLHTKTTVSEDSVQCESFGTLSVRELEYMGKKPSNWMQCFAEFFFKPDGHFNHYVTNIIGHRFIAINGREYGGK